MARAGQDAAQNASNEYSQYATSAVNNYNTQAGATSNDISKLEGQNPYTSKSYLTNQNVQTSGAMNASNTAAKQQLNDAALRTGTNTASLGRTVASNARAGQRQMDIHNADQTSANVDKNLQLQEGVIGARQNLANSEAGVFGTSAGNQTNANGQLVQEDQMNQQMWGNIIAGVAGGAGAAAGRIH